MEEILPEISVDTIIEALTKNDGKIEQTIDYILTNPTASASSPSTPTQQPRNQLPQTPQGINK